MSYRARVMLSAEGYSAPRDPLLGQVVEGRYRIMHAIGKGAMGVVYEAQHALIGRKVALKTMAMHAVSAAGVQRFRREAQAAAAVGSSHVVDVLDMGRLENGSLYIVMEHLDGVDLGFAVALEQRFSVGRAIHVLSQLCDALSAIHAAGIVHRDLKPENIFLTTRDGVPDFVKVLDFGVCKFDDAEGGRLTATGDAIGTPLFMAPEQVEGRTDCDHRADIYALGAILYFVLTGRVPFDAPNLPALFLRICHEPAPSLASTDSYLSFELDAIVQRALSKDPNERFSSCSAFKAALRCLQTTPDEVAATLPGAVDASRVTEYAWANLGGNGNGSTSLIRTQPLHGRAPWFGFGAGLLAFGVLAAWSGTHFVRSPEAEASSPQPSARAPATKTDRVPAEPPPREQSSLPIEMVIAADSGAPKPPRNKPIAGVLQTRGVHVEPSLALPSSEATASSPSPQSPPRTPASSEQITPTPPERATPTPPERATTTPAPVPSVAPLSSGPHFTRDLKHGL
jgi:eukaryotic-like serine/threonine-protein kinase